MEHLSTLLGAFGSAAKTAGDLAGHAVSIGKGVQIPGGIKNAASRALNAARQIKNSPGLEGIGQKAMNAARTLKNTVKGGVNAVNSTRVSNAASKTAGFFGRAAEQLGQKAKQLGSWVMKKADEKVTVNPYAPGLAGIGPGNMQMTTAQALALGIDPRQIAVKSGVGLLNSLTKPPRGYWEGREAPPAYSQTPSAYSQPPSAYSQAPPAYSQAPPAYPAYQRPAGFRNPYEGGGGRKRTKKASHRKGTYRLKRRR